MKRGPPPIFFFPSAPRSSKGVTTLSPGAVEAPDEAAARPARRGPDGAQQGRAARLETLGLAPAKIRIAPDHVVPIHQPLHGRSLVWRWAEAALRDPCFGYCVGPGCAS